MKPVQSLFSLVFQRPRYSPLAASAVTLARTLECFAFSTDDDDDDDDEDDDDDDDDDDDENFILSLCSSLRILEQKRDCSQSILNRTKLHCFFDLHYVAFTVLNTILTLTLHNQIIDLANVKISNRCAYDLRLSCTFVVDTLVNLPTTFNIILKYLNQHIPRKRLQASSRC